MDELFRYYLPGSDELAERLGRDEKSVDRLDVLRRILPESRGGGICEEERKSQCLARDFHKEERLTVGRDDRRNDGVVAHDDGRAR